MRHLKALLVGILVICAIVIGTGVVVFVLVNYTKVLLVLISLGIAYGVGKDVLNDW